MIIKFEPMNKDTVELIQPPRVAAGCIPEWYKNAPLHMDGEKQDSLSKETTATSNLTMKGCSPFLDALTHGYMYELPFDIEFRRDNFGKLGIRWATGIDLISGHTPEQHEGLAKPYDGYDGVLKWKFTYRIITPPGYSCLFTHPLNRNDLPFRTLSGIIETDTYPGVIEFPFQLLDNFDENVYIMEKGTPLCQIIPFKRDNWEGKKLEYNELSMAKAHFDLKSKIVRSYKTQWWKKKSFS